jgi:hypothetical protein
MSESNNHRDPFQDDPENHSVITSLVQGAVQTHRQPPEESTRKHPRYPSEDERTARKITLDLDPDTIAALRAIPQQIGAKKRLSAIAQALLDYALEAYHSGHIELQPQLGPKGICFEAIKVSNNGN